MKNRVLQPVAQIASLGKALSFNRPVRTPPAENTPPKIFFFSTVSLQVFASSVSLDLRFSFIRPSCPVFPNRFRLGKNLFASMLYVDLFKICIAF